MKKILLLIACFLFTNYVFGQDVSTAERNALISIFNNFNGNSWTNNTNWGTTNNVNTWFGVTVSTVNNEQHVTGISLLNNNISGNLSSSISNLSELQTLLINGTINSIPSQIGQNSKLQNLRLESVSLTSLPSQISNLQQLKYVQLSGQFPAFPSMFSNIASIENFYINFLYTSPTTDISNMFLNLVNLKSINIGGSNGQLILNNPIFFNSMTNLKTIYLYGFNYGQYLDLSNNKQIETLWLQGNGLEVVNLKNGFNSNFTNFASNGVRLGLQSNPLLKCVTVDNPSNAIAGISPYIRTGGQDSHDWVIYWKQNFSLNFQSNCSSYLSTSDLSKIKIKVYPNPVKDFLIIDSPEKTNKVEIYSINGQLIKTSSQKENNVSELPKGIYIVKISTDKGIQTEKFIKE